MEKNRAETPGSNSEDEFFDARESWEPEESKTQSTALPKDKLKLASTSFKSSFIRTEKKLLVPRQGSSKTLNEISLWNNKVKKNQNNSVSVETASVLVKDSFDPQKSQFARTEFDFPKANPLGYTTGELPIQPLSKQSDKMATVEIRKRVPPIAAVKTQKSMKDVLEFNSLALQQELRSGAQAIWVARFSTDGNFFAVGGEEHIVRVWQLGDYSQQCRSDTNS
eukprot:TRINITY_DN2667_c0_g1_i20.p1 TRINITY_DN2667_c0_g1~~TRINITY_DN2667_c0_g1_i20.p1  ORF type:complete len:259 (+),score=79.17 TRINITY_DN2667_c0_g1_i20:109-777(+)